ncbi:MAG: hypothetical protein JXB13_04490 [Phycisphaerae bacterium]|nr:hypothetical protein [Phycisphaerae bacterium]
MLTRTEKRWLLTGVLSALILFLLLSLVIGRGCGACAPPPEPVAVEPAAPAPRRALPDTFPRNTHRPPRPEGRVSGSIDLATFSAGRDLVYVDDPRVWWESDHDEIDTECDHTMHRALVAPLRRLIELVDARGGTLEVHDAYRPVNVHNSRSLHKEGRAVDVTCDQMPLEELAKLCWVAGFDWVYYEARGSGPHIHCSVRRDAGTAEVAAP